MLFITNRVPKGSSRTRINRKFTFDLRENAPTNSVYYCRRNGEDDCIEVGSKGFMQELKTCGAKQILFYIHGFSNLPEDDIFPRAEQLQQLCDAANPNEVLVVPLIWPCDNDFGVIGDYWDDQKSADMSAFSFARVLGKFMTWQQEANVGDAPCLKRMNVLSHSMGNRVLRETLAVWSRYDLADGVPLLFRNIFMAAPDIVNESLEKGNVGELITHSARNVTVYHASDDLALRASKASNLKNKVASRRLGHSGPEDMRKTAGNVYAIDCDGLNNSYDFPAGHAYFLLDNKGKSGVVFNHMFKALLTGRVDADAVTRRRELDKNSV